MINYDSTLSINLRTVKTMKTEIPSLFFPHAANDSFGRPQQTIASYNQKW